MISKCINKLGEYTEEQLQEMGFEPITEAQRQLALEILDDDIAAGKFDCVE